MARFGAPAALAFLLVVELATAPARAALFDDDEARKRIETLRGRVDQIERALSQRLDALETKNAGVVDLFKDVEQIKADIAKLRGQFEVLTYELEQAQKRQRDLYLDLDSRLRKLEGGPGAAAATPGATEATAHLLAARGHRLTVSLPAGPVSLVADPVRLEQVLINLLANAAKFTDPGGDIRLSAQAEAGQAVLRVRDNGRGIAPELLPRVFDLFWQGPGREEKGARGLGLGLALVKSLVELHGGSVAARSDGPGTGAEFIVRLPA